jgi:hypothetical protein
MTYWNPTLARQRIYVSARNIVANGGFEEGTTYWSITAPTRNAGTGVLSNFYPFEGKWCLDQILPAVKNGSEGSLSCYQNFRAWIYPPYIYKFSFRPENENVYLFIAHGGPLYIYPDRIYIPWNKKQTFPISWKVGDWNVLEFHVDGGKSIIYFNSEYVGELSTGTITGVYVGSYNIDTESARHVWVDDINVLVDPAKYDFDEIVTTMDGYNFYLWKSSTNRCVVLLWGGPKYDSFIQTAPVYDPVIYSEVCHNFLKDLRAYGYNVLSPTRPYPHEYLEPASFLNGLFDWIANQGWKPYLFGHSAGGTITAHEIIEKAYAAGYGAAVIAAGLMRYNNVDLVEKADQIKTNTLLIAPIDDSLTYQDIVDFYNKALASPYDVVFVQWSNGHGVFPNLSLDGRTLTDVVTTWFTQH